MGVRREVFVVEQRISEEEEYDGLDDQCVHFIAVSAGGVVGTARLRFPSSGYAKIERMAVLEPARRQGAGSGLIVCIERELAGQGMYKVVLHAQITAAPFYVACGYVPVGEHFYEAGIEHVRMEKEVGDSSHG